MRADGGDMRGEKLFKTLRGHIRHHDLLSGVLQEQSPLDARGLGLRTLAAAMGTGGVDARREQIFQMFLGFDRHGFAFSLVCATRLR